MNLPPRFILYLRTLDTLKQKWQKIPCDQNGRKINAHDVNHWRSIADIMPFATWDEKQPNAPYGVGWVLNGDGYFFVDIDDGRDAGGSWKSDAERLFLSFTGALGEVSTSGNGLHIIGRCEVAKISNSQNKWNGDREFYWDKRFVALSQQGLTPINGQASDLDWTEHLLNVIPQRKPVGKLQIGRDETYTGPDNDDELIQKMCKSYSASGAFGGIVFRDLWEANATKLGQKYLDSKRAFDHSSADAALMMHLAFWTGKDVQRMDRLFRRSMLMRDKWEKRSDYRQSTIQNAIKLCKKVYSQSDTSVGGHGNCHADMSQDDLAHHLFNEQWSGKKLYIPEKNRWATWDGKRWKLASNKNDQITQLRKDLRNVPGSEDPAKRKRLGENKNIMAIDTLMKTNEGAARSICDWDNDPFILGTPTCLVDLKTGECRPRKATDYLLNATVFDPAEKSAKPNRWLSFLDKITDGDADLVEFLQLLSGYAATGSAKEHKVFFAYGAGRNGKSTWLNTLAAILSDDYAKVIPPKLLLDKKTEQHATDLAHLANARLARASELPVGKVWDEALLKQITGGDPITARLMRQDNFTFIPQCTLIVDANNAPSIRGVDEAIRRRMCVIPFKVTIKAEDVDLDLSAKLLNEGPEILRWIIEGAVKWNTCGLKAPDAVNEASYEYLDAEDTLGNFLQERFIRNSEAKISNNQLHEMFQTFLATQGLGSWTANSLSKEMRKRGYLSYKSGSERGFKGLQIKCRLPSGSLG